jgi:hypothetical protein
LREAAIEEKLVLLLKVSTDENPAYISTKPLEGAQLETSGYHHGMPCRIASTTSRWGVPDVEWVQFLADLKADVWQENGLIQ